MILNHRTYLAFSYSENYGDDIELRRKSAKNLKVLVWSKPLKKT